MKHAVGSAAEWRSPAVMPRRWLAAIFGASAIYAILVLAISAEPVHRAWGAMAACGYGLALVAAVLPRRFSPALGADLAAALAFGGGLLVPLGWLVAHARQQPEVSVIARSGAMLLHSGTPYPAVATLAGTTNPNAFDPYLPVMALFGVPSALARSPLADPRIWFTLAFVAVFWLALRGADARDPLRWTLLVAGCPVIAFTLATGGDDAPMIACLCLGFAFLWSRSPVKAGLALGVGAAMKATAWPAVAVAIALLAVRDGRRAVVRFSLSALAVVVVCVGPFLEDPRSLIENTIEFPLGLAHVISAAASPLPGHLIASTGRDGHAVVVAVLVLAGLGVAAWLVFRPPRTVPRAMLLLCAAMSLMFLLAPSTRFGYFIYPLTLVIWLAAVAAARPRLTPDPGDPPASGRTSRGTSPAVPPAA